MDIFALLEKMKELKSSDLYLTQGLPPSWRGMDFISESKIPLNQIDITGMFEQLTTPEERKKFYAEKELNLPIKCADNRRYRANMFFQQQSIGMVIRRLDEVIPSLESLSLTQVYKDAILEQRGLVLVVGPSGSGKSTSIASMLEYRNNKGEGHIITIEDPIEYVFEHKKCIFTQREVGIDTNTWSSALRNALRQRPDVIYIGEIRDAETMAHALNFAETGHLCIATLHATSASQAVERIVNFFPTELKEQYLYSLAQVLKYVFAQRLVKSKPEYRKIPAIEILRNVGFIKPLILQGKIAEIRELLGKNSDYGMMNFEISLLELLVKGDITEETAIAESDNPDNMRLAIMKTKVRPGHAAGLLNKNIF